MLADSGGMLLPPWGREEEGQGQHVPSRVVGYLLGSLRLSALTCKAQCQEMLVSSFLNQYLKVFGAVFDSFNKWVNSDFPLMAIRCALESKALVSYPSSASC